MTGFQYFFSGDTGGRSQQINYTELVKEIKENNVTEMSYQPNGSVVEISGTYKTPQESKEDTGILFFTPNVSKVERFTSIILPSDITISDLQKLASEHNTEISIKARKFKRNVDYNPHFHRSFCDCHLLLYVHDESRWRRWCSRCHEFRPQ